MPDIATKLRALKKHTADGLHVCYRMGDLPVPSAAAAAAAANLALLEAAHGPQSMCLVGMAFGECATCNPNSR